MPKQVDHAERRAEIIRGVWALIAEAGIEAVTMRRVAAAAGVSVGRIQHYFASRSELVRASARAMITAAEGTYAAEGSAPGPAARYAVDHVIPRTDAQRVGTTIWLAYVSASVGDPEIASILAEAKRGQEDEVTRLLAEAGVAGGDAGARRRARMLVALADGLASRVLIGDLTTEEAMAVLDEAWAP